MSIYNHLTLFKRLSIIIQHLCFKLHCKFNISMLIDSEFNFKYYRLHKYKIFEFSITSNYNVAIIRVKPIPAPNTVCPMPHIMACIGGIVRSAARYINATAALVATPEVTGLTTPITINKTGKNFPYLCFLKVPNATSAAHVCTNTDENNDHKNTGYHISPNVSKGSPGVNFNISTNESNSDTRNSDNMSYMLSFGVLSSQASGQIFQIS